MHHEVSDAFDELMTVRNSYFSTAAFNGDIHTRVQEEKWSIAESVYHCYKLLKLTRIALQIYLPFAKPVVKILPEVSRNSTMTNIYEAKVMTAPTILRPGEVRHLSKGDLRHLLETETEKIKSLIQNLTDKEIYGIRLPDPVPNFPNILQIVKLIVIHERHHYNVVSERQRSL